MSKLTSPLPCNLTYSQAAEHGTIWGGIILPPTQWHLRASSLLSPFSFLARAPPSSLTPPCQRPGTPHPWHPLLMARGSQRPSAALGVVGMKPLHGLSCADTDHLSRLGSPRSASGSMGSDPTSRHCNSAFLPIDSNTMFLNRSQVLEAWMGEEGRHVKEKVAEKVCPYKVEPCSPGTPRTGICPSGFKCWALGSPKASLSKLLMLQTNEIRTSGRVALVSVFL